MGTCTLNPTPDTQVWVNGVQESPNLTGCFIDPDFGEVINDTSFFTVPLSHPTTAKQQGQSRFLLTVTV